MEKDRSRGLKHMQDKRKYKGNTTKNPKYVPAKLLPNLESNWDRYTRQEDASSLTLNSSTDFSILASAPILSGHHFQFKSDKLIAEEIEQKSLSPDLFCLDLAMIQSSILTVPFYERIGIDQKCFTDAQVRFMKSEAEENLKKYNNNLEASMKHLQLNNSDDKVSFATKAIKDVDITNKDHVDNDVLPKKVHHSVSSDVKRHIEVENKPENLEDWLDEILDE